jgi:preprotein translocase subunit SecG
MEILIVVLLVLIVGSLGHALSSMASGAPGIERSERMAQALTVRITLSAALFAVLLVGYHFGWIQPHRMH